RSRTLTRGDRLGQPRPRVLLAAPPASPDDVERVPRGRSREIGAGVTDTVEIDLRPRQPRLLHRILGVTDGPEHAVGGSEQRTAMLFEEAAVCGRVRRRPHLSSREAGAPRILP